MVGSRDLWSRRPEIDVSAHHVVSAENSVPIVTGEFSRVNWFATLFDEKDGARPVDVIVIFFFNIVVALIHRSTFTVNRDIVAIKFRDNRSNWDRMHDRFDELISTILLLKVFREA